MSAISPHFPMRIEVLTGPIDVFVSSGFSSQTFFQSSNHSCGIANQTSPFFSGCSKSVEMRSKRWRLVIVGLGAASVTAGCGGTKLAGDGVGSEWDGSEGSWSVGPTVTGPRRGRDLGTVVSACFPSSSSPTKELPRGGWEVATGRPIEG